MNQSNEQRLCEARTNGTLVDVESFPKTVTEAYEIQSAINSVSQCTINGFKIGATVPATMDMLGVEEPFFGPLYSRDTYSNNATVPIHAAHGVQVETEFVVCIDKALSAQNNELTIDHVREKTRWVAGGFEFIGLRFANVPSKRGLCAIADSGSNVAMVIGEPYQEWQALDLEHHAVTLNINDKLAGSGHSGMSIAENPLGMVAWLLNHPRMKARGLLAGDVVTCGTCTGVIPVSAGDHLVADFGLMGKLTASTIEAT